MEKAERSIPIQKFIDHLKENLHTDAEGVLHKLLQVQNWDNVIEEQLKSIEDETQKVPKPLQTILTCAMSLGWGFIVMKDDKNENLTGFILGDNDFLKTYGDKLPENQKGF